MLIKQFITPAVRFTEAKSPRVTVGAATLLTSLCDTRIARRLASRTMGRLQARPKKMPRLASALAQ
jgi:hypothetical protein